MPVTPQLSLYSYYNAPELALPKSISTVPDATPTSDGVMVAADKVALNFLVSAKPIFGNTKKMLTSGVIAPLLTINMGLVPDNSSGIIVAFSVECTDGTDVQIRTGSLNANLALKNSVFSSSQTPILPSSTITGGTLTTTFSWTYSGNVATLNMTATTSLAATDLHINFYSFFATHPNAVALA